MRASTISLLPIIAAALLLGACQSKLKDASDLPTDPSLPGVHPAGFTVPSSADFHGKTLAAGGYDLSTCTVCHGIDLKGGTARRSCLASGCHEHPDGFDEHGSTNFHGTLLPAWGYPLAGCAACHGTDFDGGAAHESCNGSGCHAKADGGPTACYTCHGDPATKKIYPAGSPAHTAHLEGGTLSATTVQCASCHVVPAAWNAPGHLDGANPNGAEVTLNDSLASTKTKGTTGTPAYDPATGACVNVYCHGNFTNGANFSPVWKGSAQAACGTCHGDAATGNPVPKSPHVAIDNCSLCHAPVVDANKRITDRSKHVNGKLMQGGNERTNW
jgi:predicted CxxxxCH...CXXCH cytochrome family protein